MKTCTACGLPAPSSTLACALCAHPFPHQGPASYRLESHAGGYRWLLDGEELMTATWRGDSWELVDTESGRVAVTLIGMSQEDGSRMAMVDHRRRAVATFIAAAEDDHGFGLVRDSYDHVLMGVRSDGPTGIHMVDTDGRVLAMASRPAPGRCVGMDLLMTRDGARRTQTIVLAVSLALELLGQRQHVS
ncbi:MAG: hypothetical protein M3396_05725 [Actinomycetota bacterium]|nr:hypothetical protein [Actinomycetota bacterium]MDQ3574717.1 hypothetical protein [Actinomycetota bacterium]